MGMLGRVEIIKEVLYFLGSTHCRRCYWMLSATHLFQKGTQCDLQMPRKAEGCSLLNRNISSNVFQTEEHFPHFPQFASEVEYRKVIIHSFALLVRLFYKDLHVSQAFTWLLRHGKRKHRHREVLDGGGGLFSGQWHDLVLSPQVICNVSPHPHVFSGHCNEWEAGLCSKPDPKVTEALHAKKLNFLGHFSYDCDHYWSGGMTAI